MIEHFDQAITEKEIWTDDPRKLSIAELKRHASVSIDNRCDCGKCFCCRCIKELKRRGKL